MAQSLSSIDELPHLNIPQQKLNLNLEGDILKVHDCLRKKYVVLTPEEYVRQQFVLWLHKEKGYPFSLMANEIGISLNGTSRRCDSVVFTPGGSPLMIIEYKAPYISITQDIFDQIVRYNIVLRARFLTVTNGMRAYCCRINYDCNNYEFLQEIPNFIEIKNTIIG